MKAASVFLIAATVGTGFLGGIGFLNFIGFGPAMKNTPAEHIVPHWQILDGYMRVRMPIFGSVILLTLIGSGILLIKQPYRQPLWFLIIALLFILTDLFVAVKYNFPFNRMVQSITPQTIPGNFEYLRGQSVLGFSIRSVCMIGSFVSTLTALVLYTAKGLQR